MNITFSYHISNSGTIVFFFFFFENAGTIVNMALTPELAQFMDRRFYCSLFFLLKKVY